MVDLTFARDLVVVLLIAFVGAIVARKLRLPLLAGYILSGFLAGVTLGRFFTFGKELAVMGEIGLAFLLFSLGIEFSFRRLTRASRVAFWGGTLQILATIVLGLLIFPFFGFNFYSSLFLASVFSLSSTAIVVKILSERGEVDSLHGEIMVGWLLVQDLAAAFTTSSLGLSFALGALFAGLLVSESSQKHAIFSEVRPLRDVFSVVF